MIENEILMLFGNCDFQYRKFIIKSEKEGKQNEECEIYGLIIVLIYGNYYFELLNDY